MAIYRHYPQDRTANLKYLREGDKFSFNSQVYIICERIVDNTHRVKNLTSGNDINLHLNEVLEKLHNGNYNNFRRLKIEHLHKSDIIITATSQYYTVIDFETTDYNEYMAVVKDGTSNKIKIVRVEFFLDKINEDKYNIIRNNNKSSNEKISVTNTDIDREGEARAITSSTTRLITSSSRLVGNAKASAIKTTRTCSFEISKNSISS